MIFAIVQGKAVCMKIAEKLKIDIAIISTFWGATISKKW